MSATTLKIVPDNAEDAIASQLDIFEPPFAEQGIKDIREVDIYPTNSLTSNPVSFKVLPEGPIYFDIGNIKLYMKWQILKENGDNLEAADVVGPINCPHSSFWKDVDFSISHVKIGKTNSMYPFSAYFQMLCSNKLSDTSLQSMLWIKDTSGPAFNAVTTGAQDEASFNEGFNARYNMTKMSNVVDTIGPLFCDISSLKRFLLFGNSLQINLWRADEKFALMTATKDCPYKINLISCFLRIQHVTVDPHVVEYHTKTILKQPALYPFIQNNIKAFTIATGAHMFQESDIFNNIVPHKMIFCLLDSEAFLGSPLKSPFCMVNYDLDQIEIQVNGQPFPHKAHKLNFSQSAQEDHKSNYVTAYNALVTALEKEHPTTTIISRSDYKFGYTLFLVDSDADQFSDYMVTPSRRVGNVTISLIFKTPLPSGVTLICYGQIADQFRVDYTNAILYP